MCFSCGAAAVVKYYFEMYDSSLGKFKLEGVEVNSLKKKYK